jgi:predicted AlkP superfamily phosphohydrolase/phosphomutase
VNVVGRDPHGVVSPGRDYDETCRELRRELLALTDPRTGVPLVRDVVVTHDQYPGNRQENFADVLVVWSQDQPVRAAASSLIGEVRGRAPQDRTGNHRPNGWFVATGPGIAPSVLEQPVSVLDLAPTVAALLGVSLPGAEGSCIDALLPDQA